jgi:hypothetical protein
MWPYTIVPPPYRWLVLLVLIGLTFGIGWILAVIGPTPSGNLLQRAWSEANARALMKTWGSAGTLRAIHNVWVDFLFIPAYVITIVFACSWLADASGPGNWQDLGIALARAMWVAGFLDVIEDIGLLAMLYGRISDRIAQVTTFCASAKYAILLASAGYVLLMPLGIVCAHLRKVR